MKENGKYYIELNFGKNKTLNLSAKSKIIQKKAANKTPKLKNLKKKMTAKQVKNSILAKAGFENLFRLGWNQKISLLDEINQYAPTCDDCNIPSIGTVTPIS